MQCSGSNIASALIDGVNKHNDRNPDNRIIYLNCGAVAPELTNEQCSFWHFRFDLHAGMSVVFGLADRITVLVYGEVIASDAPTAIRGNAAVQEAYLGTVAACRARRHRRSSRR